MLQQKSFGSVRTFWLDRDELRRRAEKDARALLAQHPEVTRVGVFGSVARGTAVPGSDLDVMVILSDDGEVPRLRPCDRAARYQPSFDEVGVGVDLFCLAERETALSPIYLRNAGEAIWIRRG